MIIQKLVQNCKYQTAEVMTRLMIYNLLDHLCDTGRRPTTNIVQRELRWSIFLFRIR